MDKKIKKKISKDFKLSDTMQYIIVCSELLKQHLQGNLWHLIKFKINYLKFQFKKLESEEKIKLKTNRKNKIIRAKSQ